MFSADLVAEAVAVTQVIKKLTNAKGRWAVLISVVVSGAVAAIDQARETQTLNPLTFLGTWLNTLVGSSGGYMVGEDFAHKAGKALAAMKDAISPLTK